MVEQERVWVPLCEPVSERCRGSKLRQAPSPALLARRLEHTTPVLLAFFEPRPVEPDYTAFGEEGTDAGHAELHRFLNRKIHALALGYTHTKVYFKHGRRLRLGRLVELHQRRLLGWRQKPTGNIAAVAVEQDEAISGAQS
jgi:hypothetical protein